MNSSTKERRAGEKCEGEFSEHRRTLHCFVVDTSSPEERFARSDLKLKTHRFGKQKRRFDSPRHQPPRFSSVAFIFDKCATCMVNRWCAPRRLHCSAVFPREPDVKLMRLGRDID